MKRQALQPEMATQWAQMAHALYLDSLMVEADWTAGEIAFHGGTSLRLSWNSPRYSEDLDFLLSRTAAGLDDVMRRVEARIQQMARRLDADFVVTMADKTKDAQRMPVFMLTVSHPGYVGVAKVRGEFWRTDPAYLRNYPTQQRMPGGQLASASPLDVFALTSNPVPAATLETAYADKLVAFATRPFLKWRDIYDFWWIGTQTKAPLDMANVVQQFLHNVTAYTPLQGLPPAQALMLFLDKPKDEIIRAADPDLKNWLPENLWQRLNPNGVREMVDYALFAISSIAAHIEGVADDDQDVDLKSVPRPRG